MGGSYKIGAGFQGLAHLTQILPITVASWFLMRSKFSVDYEFNMMELIP